MNRPYIICHMVASLDGKVTGSFLWSADSASATEEYYRMNREYKADAFACGRTTMEESFTQGAVPDYSAFGDTVLSREDYIACPEAAYYAVAFDRRGHLGWEAEKITDEDPGYNNAYIIEVLCEDTPDASLAYFRSRGISYIFAGEHELNLELALDKLYSCFGIRKLLLEGGSRINGAFASEDLIDEISLVVSPVVSADGLPLFADAVQTSWHLQETKPLQNNTLFLHYTKKAQAEQ